MNDEQFNNRKIFILKYYKIGLCQQPIMISDYRQVIRSQKINNNSGYILILFVHNVYI